MWESEIRESIFLSVFKPKLYLVNVKVAPTLDCIQMPCLVKTAMKTKATIMQKYNSND